MRTEIRPMSLTSHVLVGLLSFTLALPIFILLYRFLPDFQWPYNTDKVLIFFLIAVLLLMMVRSYKIVIGAIVLAMVSGLSYGTITNQYGFKDIMEDGKAVFYSIQKDDKNDFVFTGTRSLTTDREIVKAIDYENSEVRTFAVNATNEFFKKEQQTKMKYRVMVQSFAVFKKINDNWNYVNDPQDDEYIARASESVKLLAGDCDDYSILMAAAIKSIGGTVRLVYTKGHIYPEILIGNKKDLEYASTLIRRKLFTSIIRGRDIHYHKDEKGQIWMNLDYTASYPGGKFMGEEVIECLYP